MLDPHPACLTAVIMLAAAAPLFAAQSGGRHRYEDEVPLSKRPPEAIVELPSFGRIEWEVRRLPFVAEGPYAGISGVGMAVVNGKIYLCGGFIPAGDETEDKASRRTSRWAYSYDPSTEKWQRLPDLPGRREYTRAIGSEQALYVVGGACQLKGAEIPYRPFGDCFQFDPRVVPSAWQRHSQLSVPRTHMAVGCVGPWLMVAGGNEYDFSKRGYHKSTIRGLTEALDLRHEGRGWQRLSPLPGPPRGWVASSVCQGRMYVLGGLTFDPRQVRLRHVVSLDPERNQWKQHQDVPVPVSGWEGATYADRYVLLVGGVVATPGKNLWNDQPLAYDAKQDRWLRVEGLLPPGAVFNDAGVCVIRDRIYVAGGEGPFGSHFNYFLIGKIKPDEPRSPTTGP